MTEAMIYVSDNAPGAPGYDDGDIMQVFTDACIGDCHAQMICDHRKLPIKANGLRADGLGRDYLDLVYQYRFERVSALTVNRIRLADMHVDTFGPPMDVQMYIDRRKAHPRHRVFGETGREIWHGGRRRVAAADVDAQWQLIEAETRHRRTSFEHWPLSETEKRHFLALPLSGLSEANAVEAQANEIEWDEMQPEFTDPPGIVGARKRRVSVPWRDVAGVNVEDVLNRDRLVDYRETAAATTTTDMQVKPRKNVWSVRGHLTSRERFFS